MMSYYTLIGTKTNRCAVLREDVSYEGFVKTIMNLNNSKLKTMSLGKPFNRYILTLS